MNKQINSYIIGFLLSLLLTFSSFILVWIHVNSSNETIPREILIPAIIVIALIQLVVQLLFFLHMISESRPRWNLIFFISTVGLIVIVVIGSMWIMQHLNYNMTPKQVNQYIQSQDGF